MEDRYYSERLLGDGPREKEEISLDFWGGFVSLVYARSRDGWFAERFPTHCFEAPLPIETDTAALGSAFSAHNPRVEWPLKAASVPYILDVLDSVEFIGKIVSKPVHATYS